MNRARRAWLLLLLILAGSAVVWLTRPVPVLPDLPITFTDGTQARLADYRGHPLVLDFWSVDCPACLADMPRLRTLYPEIRRRGAALIGVNIPQDPPPAAMAMARQLDVPWPLALDPRGELNQAVGVVHITPTLVFIDRGGRVAGRHHGPLDPQQLLARIDALADKD